MPNISSVALIISGVSDECFAKIVALRALRQGDGKIGYDQVARYVGDVLRAYEIELREELNVGGVEALMFADVYDPSADLPALLHMSACRTE